MNRELPNKESTIFKNILKFYEYKQYKKGLKAADGILKKFPEHGETLAMKGLFCSHLDRKTEAHDLIKKGIRNDITSHICWHVYGLLHRSEKNYEEALKCYACALRYDKDNQQISRDYSLLLIQMRNLESFNESKMQALKARPNIRNNYTSCAISYHLVENYELAISVLTEFEDSFQDEMIKSYENSEHHLYKNLLIELSGDYNKALQHLENIRRNVVDMTRWRESKARILLKSGKNELAEVEFRKLIDDNSENIDYLIGLQTARGLLGPPFSPDEFEKLFRLYRELESKYPRSFAIKILPLKYASGDEFVSRVKQYLYLAFRSGIPSAFNQLKQLIYGNETKARFVFEIVNELIQTLTETQSKESISSNTLIQVADTKCSPNRSTTSETLSLTSDNQVTETNEPPTTLLWALYFMAQHLDWSSQYSKALEMINKAIQHSPTLVEAYMIRAKIFKHMGASRKASESMNLARELDLQDRFVNSKSVKYMLRTGNVALAEQTISLFTRSESKDPLQDLVEMQCTWFAYEAALAYKNSNNLGLALKKLHQIEKMFADTYDDQFDFHSYALRKMTLISYVNLLKTEDHIRSHPFYLKAALEAVKIYLHLLVSPKKSELDSSMTELSLSEKKKAQRKARKAELKKTLDPSPPANGPKKCVDEDPLGLKYLEQDPLVAVMTFLKPLLEYRRDDLQVLLAGVEIFLLKQSYLQAFKCLKRAFKISPQDPRVFKAMIKFHDQLDELIKQGSLEKTVLDILESQSLLESLDLNEYLKNWIDSAHTADQLLGCFIVLRDRNQLEYAKEFVLKVRESETRGLTLSTAIDICQAVKKDKELSYHFIALGKSLFSESDYFLNSPEDI